MKTALHIINTYPAKWLLFGLTALLATGCNSVYMNFDYDDVYGNAPSRNEEARLLAKQYRQNRPDGNSSGQADNPQLYYDENTGIYYTYDEATGEYTPYEADTNSYEYPEFDYDKYYDYEYSSRLKRFHQDDYITDNYYDDYYTNTYWYDNNPYSYGTSIYLGFNNWSPSFTVWGGGGWSLGLSYGYDPFWYRSCRYWPSYSYWDWGWPGYWGPGYWHGWGWGSGYWHGYWDGYHDGFWGSHWVDNDYFYNSFDKNTYYKQEIRQRRGERQRFAAFGRTPWRRYGRRQRHGRYGDGKQSETGRNGRFPGDRRFPFAFAADRFVRRTLSGGRQPRPDKR